VAGLAKWSGKRRIAILARNVMLLNSKTATAEQAAISIRSPRESPGGIDRVFVDHDEDSGRA
jgi:hypothetical protein